MTHGDQVRSELTFVRGSGFAAAVLLIMFSEQVIVSSGALIMRIAVDAEAAGNIFNILLVARAPLLLFQAIAASLLPHLTGLWTQGDADSLRAFHGSVRKTVLVIVAFAAAAIVGLLAIGPQVMQAAFGDQFAYDRSGLVIVGVGMGFYLCAATLSQAALAQGQARRASLCWALCAATFIVVNLLPGLDRFRQVEVGFAAAGILLLGASVRRLPTAGAADRGLARTRLAARARRPARGRRRDLLVAWSRGLSARAPAPGTACVRSSRGLSRTSAGRPCSTITPPSMNTTRLRDLAREADLVGDDDHRHPLAGQLAHHVEHLLDQLGVERRGDLVEQHHVRVHRERPRDRHPLLLAAREPVRVLVELVGEADPGQQRLAASRAASARRGRGPSPGARQTFSSADLCGKRLNCWKTIPTRRRT